MNYSTAAIAIVILSLSCTRQPIGIAGSPNTPVPAPVEDGTVAPNPDMNEARVMRSAKDLAPGSLVTDTSALSRQPDEAAIKARRREEVRNRWAVGQPPRIEENETAEIENQASVGQAPLTESGYRTDAPATEPPPELIFRKSNCYGDCEAYTFSLRSGGLTSLLVDNGELARGLYNRQLYSVDYEALYHSVDSLRGQTFEPLYPVDQEIPTDIPYRMITIPDAKGTPRSIKVYSGAPPALQRFMDRLERLIGEQSWQRSTDSDGQ